MIQTVETLSALLTRVRQCDVCAQHLPLGPRPVVRAAISAKVLIIGQAPGTKVHETGIPWNDQSGVRLRDWLDLSAAEFYDVANIAIVPTGFCYPGRDLKGGDMPPRPECAPMWHAPIFSHLKNVELTLLVGMYAQKTVLGPKMLRTMTETIRAWRSFQPNILPLPHPSWRTLHWARKNPWFEAEVLPALKTRIHAVLATGNT
tara:strand:- start:25348 stop:25956 length:609 start_codon:yes stop_codon:yes gene_type:complete